MKKTLLIITLFIGLGNVNAQSKETKTVEDEWNETIAWIKSKSSYYDINFKGKSWNRIIDVKQYFSIYSDFTFKIERIETAKRKIWTIKGDLKDISTHRNAYAEPSKNDSRVSELTVDNYNKFKYATTGYSGDDKFRLIVLNKEDMPERLANAFNRLSEIRQEYAKFLKAKEENRIKSYGEKF